MDTLETIKGFLMQPVESFRKVRGTSLGDAITYFLIIVIINTILTVIVDLVFASAILAMFTQVMVQMGMGEVFLMEMIGMVAVAIIMVIASLVLLFVFAGWLHLFVYLLGGRKGYAETVKAMIFGSTPYMLIGWIPVIGLFVGGIWSLILEILGIRELHQVSTGRAAGAVVLSVFILALLIILIAAWFFISLVSVMPVTYQ
ncbi:MAG: Yip1 domain protein [Methanoregulaceae archaeon PtaU1.Bin059]|nr:MAG: Yip1 domain protein [Methanoregulaceae archaeon PtaB.Bin152]OPY39233.1 MAG: Yip1 domain protein [Methanoregulaceae archaeon PtaU1.Bin059]